MAACSCLDIPKGGLESVILIAHKLHVRMKDWLSLSMFSVDICGVTYEPTSECITPKYNENQECFLLAKSLGRAK